MPLLPDLGTAGLYAVAAFLLVLGILVVFVESIRPSRFLAVVFASVFAAAGLLLLGEAGVAIILVGIAGAFIANHIFEWLTAR